MENKSPGGKSDMSKTYVDVEIPITGRLLRREKNNAIFIIL